MDSSQCGDTGRAVLSFKLVEQTQPEETFDVTLTFFGSLARELLCPAVPLSLYIYIYIYIYISLSLSLSLFLSPSTQSLQAHWADVRRVVAIDAWLTSQIALSYTGSKGPVSASYNLSTGQTWFAARSGFGYTCAGSVTVGSPGTSPIAAVFADVLVQPFNVASGSVSPAPGGNPCIGHHKPVCLRICLCALLVLSTLLVLPLPARSHHPLQVSWTTACHPHRHRMTATTTLETQQ